MDSEKENQLEALKKLIYSKDNNLDLVEQLLNIEELADEFYKWLDEAKEYCMKVIKEVFNDNDNIIERYYHVVEKYKLKIGAYIHSSYRHSIFTEGGSSLDLYLTTGKIEGDIKRLSGEYSIILDIKIKDI